MGGESPLVLTLLVLLCLCAVVTAVTLVAMAVEMRQTLRRVNGMLPQCEAAVRQANVLLSRTNRATRSIERVIRRASSTLLDWIEQAGELKRTAQSIIAARLGNGHRAGVEPRRTSGRRGYRRERE